MIAELQMTTLFTYFQNTTKPKLPYLSELLEKVKFLSNWEKLQADTHKMTFWSWKQGKEKKIIWH